VIFDGGRSPPHVMLSDDPAVVSGNLVVNTAVVALLRPQNDQNIQKKMNLNITEHAIMITGKVDDKLSNWNLGLANFKI
jgi:hypothetical protein